MSDSRVSILLLIAPAKIAVTQKDLINNFHRFKENENLSQYLIYFHH